MNKLSKLESLLNNNIIVITIYLLGLVVFAICLFYFRKKKEYKKEDTKKFKQNTKDAIFYIENVKNKEIERQNILKSKIAELNSFANKNIAIQKEAEKKALIEAEQAKQDAEKIILEQKIKIQKEAERKALIVAEINRQLKEVTIKDELTKKEEERETKFDNLKRQTQTPYINSNEVLIKVIKSIPESTSSAPKRIGYSPNRKFEQIEPYNYAVVKMPQHNSLIKFPRKGRSDKKGYKEDSFYADLKSHFKSTFNVLNDRHIPTENGRPYEPDFVLSSEKDNTNIFINIEIDEPYDGWLRTPTHCISENDLRDEFFTKRGWIIIRFAEIQIHNEPQKCCALIAKVIRSIDSTFTSELLNEQNPNEIIQWDNLQAKKWAIQKYRENT